MRTFPAVFVLLSALIAFAACENNVANQRKRIVSFIKTRNAVTPTKRRWKGNMYSKLRKDESPPPTNNQLDPSLNDVTPAPGGEAPTSGKATPGAQTQGQLDGNPYSPYGRQQYGNPQQLYGQPPYVQQPYLQPPFAQQQFDKEPPTQQHPPPQGNKLPNVAAPPPGQADGGCGTSTVCGSFSLSREDPSSVISPPAVMMPQQQQPCMPQAQGCGGAAAPPPMCPSVCGKKCMVTCPKHCCPKSAIPGSEGHATEPAKTDEKCSAVCSVYCAPECSHNCCGPGGARRSYIMRRRVFHASELSPPAIWEIENEAGGLNRR